MFDKHARQCRGIFVPVIETSINCTTPIALDSHEYEPGVDNSTLSFQGNLYRIIDHDASGRPVICTNYTRFGIVERIVNNTVTPVAFTYITYVTTSMSIIGSIAILLTYSIFKKSSALYPAKFS